MILSSGSIFLTVLLKLVSVNFAHLFTREQLFMVYQYVGNSCVCANIYGYDNVNMVNGDPSCILIN